MQIYEKEFLAVIHALESWKHCLLGADFTVQTDHQSLRYFLTRAKLSKKHFSWANFLSMFHFQLVHVASKKNVVADALSRRPHVAAVSIAYQQELDEMRDHYSTDEDFAEPYDALVRGEHPDSYSLKDGFLMFRRKLCVSRLLRQKVMTKSHSPPYAGHRGIDSTIKALEMYFFWPSLRKDTESFVRSCLICQRVKYDRGKAYGLLQPLPIPTAPWESIAMDFIFGLPKTSSGNEGIWTIADRFSKQAHFIPVRKQITAEQTAKIFLVTMFKYRGMPRSIVSDRDPRMTGLFWRALWQNLHSTLRFSSSYHPQTDAPFEIVEAAQKPPPMVKVMDDVFEVDKFVEDLDLAYQQVQQAIQKAHEKQKKAADKHRRRLHFREGDWVLLQFEKARLRKQKGKEKFYLKLRMRYYGPFQISEVINDVSYRLSLPTPTPLSTDRLNHENKRALTYFVSRVKLGTGLTVHLPCGSYDGRIGISY
ncbi:hypothetical protein L7F22_055586 [Adiantum nelumboides]|nr:hypothetical protein [Adiantum nelumboides]